MSKEITKEQWWHAMTKLQETVKEYLRIPEDPDALEELKAALEHSENLIGRKARDIVRP